MMDMSAMKRQIQGVDFPYPLMVGGGIVKTHEQVRKLAPTDIVAEWGSIESEPSNGNGGRDYYPFYHYGAGGEKMLVYALNSRGIPNPGIKYVEQHSRDMLALYADHNKPLVLNVSGTSPVDAVNLVLRAQALGFSVITLNGACPNKVKNKILCWDIASIDEVFFSLDGKIDNDTLVFWKISAGMPRDLLIYNCAHVRDSEWCGGIICCNTVPNGFALRPTPPGGSAILTEKGNLDRGGISGPAMKPLAMDHAALALVMSGKVVIGAGGVDSAIAAHDYLRLGCRLVQMTTAFWENNEDPAFFRDVLEQLYYKLNPVLAN